jgi:hypothetical protein
MITYLYRIDLLTNIAVACFQATVAMNAPNAAGVKQLRVVSAGMAEVFRTGEKRAR